MPATQYAAWQRHLSRHPPTQEHTHFLLARLIQVVAATAGQQWELAEIAPWLPGVAPVQKIGKPQQGVMDALLEGRFAKG